MRRLILLAAALVACAQQGFPPGGPEEKTPPKLLSVKPESGAVNVRQKSVDLDFDEVINERPASATDLSSLVLVSPRDGLPRVGWHRTRLTIRGRHDWRANTAYTVTVLPGIADLRGNVRKEATVIVFSTGSTIPHGRISGIAFDWVAGKSIPLAVVDVIAHPDSVLYIGRADSVGRFVVPTLPPGEYTVIAFADQNNDQTLEPREVWDSAHITLTDTAHTELYAFLHDTIGPRITATDVRDSVTLRMAFDKAVDTTQHLDTTSFRLTSADSTVIPLARVISGAALDKATRDSLARDSAKARLDSTAAAREREVQRRFGGDTTLRRPTLTGPQPNRPSPAIDFVLTPSRPFVPGATYRLEAGDVRNLLGHSATSFKVFIVPKVTAADSAARRKAAADSVARRKAAADSAAKRHAPGAPPDTTHPPPPPDTTHRTPPP